MLVGESDTLGASDPLLKTGRVQCLVQTSAQFFYSNLFPGKKKRISHFSQLSLRALVRVTYDHTPCCTLAISDGPL